MKLPSSLNNEKTMLGVLAVILAGVLLLPWLLQSDENDQRLDQDKRADSGSKNSAPRYGVPSPRAFRGKRETSWIAKVVYAPQAGSIEVDLRHRDIPVDEQLKVHANFKTAQSRQRVGSRWLSRQPNGVYRSGDLHLLPGKWTMGLTGYRQSKFAFRLEQVLDVK